MSSLDERLYRFIVLHGITKSRSGIRKVLISMKGYPMMKRLTVLGRVEFGQLY